MAYLHRSGSIVQAARPVQVVQADVVFDGDLEPPRQEVFVGDTVIQRVQLALAFLPQDDSDARIAAPADGVIFALDQAITADRQRGGVRAANVARSEERGVGEGGVRRGKVG